MTDDLEDLMSGISAPVKRMGRPPVPAGERLAGQRNLLAGVAPPKPEPEFVYSEDEHEALGQVLERGDVPSIAVLKRGVSLTNLATLVGKEPRRVAGLLSRCPVVGTVQAGKHKGQPTYDIKDAINYLATPPADHIETWIRSQTPATVPPFIHKAFWEAMRIKMRVLEESGELWHSSEVQVVLGVITKTMNDAMLLWIEKLPGAQQMPTEQYDNLRKQVIGLQKEIAEAVSEAVSKIAASPYRADVDAMMDGAVESTED